MSIQATASRSIAPPIWARGLIAAAVGAVANMIVFLTGTRAGADMAVVTAGTQITVALPSVLIATTVPLALAGVATWFLTRWKAQLRIVLAWGGLAVAIATILVPLTSAPQTATGWTLGTMHIIAGLTWCAAMSIHTRTSPA